MKLLPRFRSVFIDFVQEEAYNEAGDILDEKDPPRKEFRIEDLRNFTYKEQLNKGSFLRNQ